MRGLCRCLQQIKLPLVNLTLLCCFREWNSGCRVMMKLDIQNRWQTGSWTSDHDTVCILMKPSGKRQSISQFCSLLVNGTPFTEAIGFEMAETAKQRAQDCSNQPGSQSKHRQCIHGTMKNEPTGTFFMIEGGTLDFGGLKFPFPVAPFFFLQSWVVAQAVTWTVIREGKVMKVTPLARSNSWTFGILRRLPVLTEMMSPWHYTPTQPGPSATTEKWHP